jgi:hypothetical protein
MMDLPVSLSYVVSMSVSRSRLLLVSNQFSVVSAWLLYLLGILSFVGWKITIFFLKSIKKGICSSSFVLCCACCCFLHHHWRCSCVRRVVTTRVFVFNVLGIAT